MENDRIEKGTVARILKKMRKAVADDPDSPLALFVEHDPGDDYDPNERPEDRQPEDRQPDA